MKSRWMIFLLVAAGCTRDEPDELTDIACAANDVVPAVLDCTWSSLERGAGFVEIWLDGAPGTTRVTPVGPDGSAHEAHVLGLKAGRDYRYRLVVERPDGTRQESGVRSHTVPDVPRYFPGVVRTGADEARSGLADAYLLTSLVIATDDDTRTSAVVILDGEGDYVWWYQTVDWGLSISPRFGRDGESLLFLSSDILWEDDIGVITRVALDGSTVTETRALLGHHDIWENPDGTLTWIGFDYRQFDDEEWASDALRTAEEGATDELAFTEEFNWFDAYEADPWHPDPGEDQVSLGTASEWTHSNSLMSLDDTHFYIMSKKLDCIVKVDRRDGSLLWQMGGPNGDFTHPDGSSVFRNLWDNDLWSHAHMSHIWDGGMVVFDNGFFNGDGLHSRAVEYRFDEEARTVEEVWRYEEPSGGFTGTMGDVRKLDNGNYLIGWSHLGYVNEVTPEGDVVWQIELTTDEIFGRVRFLEDLYALPDGGLP